MELGIYEEIISKSISQKLKTVEIGSYKIEKTILDRAEAVKLLTRYISNIIHTALGVFTGDNNLENQLNFCNELIYFIDKNIKGLDFKVNLLDVEGQILQAILDRIGKSDEQLKRELISKLPQTGLSVSTLFTGSNSDLSLDVELEKEIRSADRVYWIVSFIRWSGLRIFKDVLKEFTTQAGKELKIITTSYMGATEHKAIEFLSSLPNTEIRISYNIKHERLHAKSYIFERNTGFDTAYIGSSNLSYSALTKGLEWNIKTTSRENKHIIQKAKGTFESYWLNTDFEDYRVGGSIKLREALTQASKPQSDMEIFLPNFKVHPYPFQNEILDKLEVERKIHNSYQNLIVAATGVGKTVIAAFDYKRYYKENYTKNRLLFIAHREEILKQSLATFRAILNDSEFGDLWVGNYKPENNKHLFVSIQTFTSNLSFFKECFTTDYYQYVIVDEVHHIAASSYRPLLDYFQPEILLGLTATPERMDGQFITDDFNNRIAAETRLPDALRLGLLCPFQYFCVADTSVDLRNIKWVNGRYDINELENIYTADNVRINLIIRSLYEYLVSIESTSALGFCINRSHAKYMTEQFNKNGLKADYIISGNGNDNKKVRQSIRHKLKTKAINFVFVVDIFNEGVDIPEINTVLFLRPTESLTIFLQQLGRGLRLHEGKECLTVLDFVAQAHEKFNYADKLQALVGRTHHSIDKELKQGFPHLPFGCAIKMEKTAQKYILDNIYSATYNKRRLIREIIHFCNDSTLTLTLLNFLKRYNIDIQTIYRNNTWTSLKAEALNQRREIAVNEKILAKGIKRIALTNSPLYLNFISSFVKNGLDLSTLQNEEHKIMALMFYYDLWQKPITKLGFKNLEQAFNEIKKCEQICAEILEVVEVQLSKVDFIASKFSLAYTCPLEVHARYSRDQLLCVFGLSIPEKCYSSREGVVRIKEKNTELLLVTLNKSDKDFSPSTMYDDYALNESIFHWQSQNITQPNSPVGKSYINQKEIGKNILLFVREHKKDAFGMTMNYLFLGSVEYVKHQGASPMSITWQMKEPIPAYIWKDSVKLSVG